VRVEAYNTSNGYAINARGQVTGQAVTARGVFHAFLSSPSRGIDPSIAVHVMLVSGKAINDEGWIVANGVDSRTDQTYAYLLSRQ